MPAGSDAVGGDGAELHGYQSPLKCLEAVPEPPLASIHRPGLDGGWTESAAG